MKGVQFIIFCQLIALAKMTGNVFRSTKFDQLYDAQWNPISLYTVEGASEVGCGLMCMADSGCKGFFQNRNFSKCGWAIGNIVSQENGFKIDSETRFFSKCGTPDKWTVLTYTDWQSTLGVNSWLYLTVYGVGGPRVIPKDLDDYLKDEGEPGQIDSYDVELPCINEPYRLKLWSPNTNSGIPWLMNKIEFIRYDNFKVEFTLDRWLFEWHQETYCLELFADGFAGNTGEIIECTIDEEMLDYDEFYRNEYNNLYGGKK